MVMVTRIQILNVAVCTHITLIVRKVINPIILPPVMGK